MPRIVAELQLELNGDDTVDAPLDLTLADMQHLTEMGISLSLVTRCAAA